MNTGTTISGRPSMGSWIQYGLGSEAEDLPGFVVLSSHAGRSPQPISVRMWHAGFLPSQFQGIQLRSTGDPVMYVRRPSGVDADRQRDVVDAAASTTSRCRSASTPLGRRTYITGSPVDRS